MPRIADEHEPRLQRTRNGRVLVTLKSAWSDGATHFSESVLVRLAIQGELNAAGLKYRG